MLGISEGESEGIVDGTEKGELVGCLDVDGDSLGCLLVGAPDAVGGMLGNGLVGISDVVGCDDGNAVGCEVGNGRQGEASRRACSSQGPDAIDSRRHSMYSFSLIHSSTWFFHLQSQRLLMLSFRSAPQPWEGPGVGGSPTKKPTSLLRT